MKKIYYFKSRVIFRGHVTKNRKKRYAVILMSSVFYHLMKFQICRFDNIGAAAIQYIER